MRRSRARSTPAILSLIDVACGAFGGLLLLAMVLIRVAPPSTTSLPSGFLTVQLPTMLSELNDYHMLLAPEIRVDGKRIDVPQSGIRTTLTDTGWCNRCEIETVHEPDGKGMFRIVVRVSVEGLRRPVTLEYSVKPGFTRVLPTEVTVSVMGTAFHKHLRESLRAIGNRLRYRPGPRQRIPNVLAIHLDPSVRRPERFLQFLEIHRRVP